MMTRYFLEVMYDGTAFHGSQIQKNALTVQLEINKALRTLLREETASFGASRTDEGVHAISNFYHFDTGTELHPHFHYKINALLPRTISVRKVFRCTGNAINSRFDAIARKYRYRIYHKKDPFRFQRALYYPFRINKEILNQTAGIIKEYTSFESFSKRKTQSFTFNCIIFESFWQEEKEELQYIVKANRFLRGMVRGLVGTQLQVARGKISLDGFRKIIEAKDCTGADFSVPGFGLYLEEIAYPEGSLEELFLM